MRRFGKICKSEVVDTALSVVEFVSLDILWGVLVISGDE